MSSYDKLSAAQKRAYHVVECLRKRGGGAALREVYKHCSSGQESRNHSFYDQLNLPKDGFLEPPPKFGQAARTGNAGQREQEPLQRKDELDKWDAALKPRDTEQIARQKKLQQSEEALKLRETQLNDWEAKLTERETRFGASKKSVQVRFDVSDSISDDAPDEASEGPASRVPGKEMVWCDKCELLFDPKRNHARACQYHPRKLDTINPEDCQRLTGMPAEAFDSREGLEFLLSSYPRCLEFGCCFSKSRAGCKVGPHQSPVLW